MTLLPALLLAAAPAPASAGVEGVWLTDDRKGEVTITRCGHSLCGRTTRVRDSGPRVPKADVNNPDPKLRGRPILGMTVLSGFTRAGNGWKNGRAYDPKSGRSYRASLALQPDGALKVTGCVLVICKSRRWTRLR